MSPPATERQLKWYLRLPVPARAEFVDFRELLDSHRRANRTL